jgi:hypothetical protein
MTILRIILIFESSVSCSRFQVLKSQMSNRPNPILKKLTCKKYLNQIIFILQKWEVLYDIFLLLEILWTHKGFCQQENDEPFK